VKNFLPTHDFWDSWLLDIIDNADINVAKDIFNIALSSCPNVNLALKYSNYLNAEHDEGNLVSIII